MSQQKVGIIMGSDSDFPVMEKALAILDKAGVAYEVRIISAHRTPEEMLNYAKDAKARGYAIIIAGAGGAAHLPGMIASMCSLPVIGVPVKSRSMEGVDSILSILQMPAGIPVATVGLNNAAGAAKLAVRILRCYENIKNARQVPPHIKIMFDAADASREDLEKVIETLHFYKLGHEVIDLSEERNTTFLSKCNMLAESDSMAILNLANFAKDVIEKINSMTTVPIISVPTKENAPSLPNSCEQSMQTVEELCKMSNGLSENVSPVAMLAVNGYQNAGIMLARMAGIHDVEVYNRVADQQGALREMVIKKDKDISAKFSCKI